MRRLVVALVVGFVLAACGGGTDVAEGSSQPPATVKAPPGEPSVVGTATKVTAGASCADADASGGDDGVVSSDDASASCPPTSDGSVTVLVQDGKDPSGAALAASVRVPASAAVLRSSDGGYTKASPDDLREGDAVRVWFTGPVAESYPVQATAATVIITG
jgi:hypothetical protein